MSLLIVSSTELQNNFGKYLMLAAQEDIVITRNGLEIAKLTAIRESALDDTNLTNVVYEKAPEYSPLGKKHLMMNFFTYNRSPMNGTSILTVKSIYSHRQERFIK